MLVINDLTLFLLCSLVAFLIVYYVLFIYKNWKYLKFAWNNHAFFVPLLPIFGHSFFWFLPILPNGLPVNVLTLIQWARRYLGSPINFWYGSSYFYITSTPEEIKTILNHSKCYNKGRMYENFVPLFSKSIFLAPYEKWIIKRRLVQNSFNFSVLKKFVPTFYQQSCKLLEDYNNLNNSKNIFNYLSEYVYVNFILTSGGLEEKNCDQDLRQLGLHFRSFQERLSAKMLDPIIPLNTWLRFFPFGQKCNKSVDKIMSNSRSLILQKQQQYNCDLKEYDNGNEVMPLIDLLVNVASKMMDEDELRYEITFFTVAATETTSTALTFCFLLLGMHPEVQETLYQEVIKEVGDKEISCEVLPKLRYTKAVIQETLRLFPSVPFVQRLVGEDVNFGNQVVPEGTSVTADIFHLHRDEKYWPNPLKFDPNRFLPENVSKIKPYTYLPFSAGIRDCFGKRHVMLVMKTTVANVIRKLKITSTHKSIDEFSLTSVITLKSEYPVNCQFSPRLID